MAKNRHVVSSHQNCALHWGGNAIDRDRPHGPLRVSAGIPCIAVPGQNTRLDIDRGPIGLSWGGS